MIQHAKGGKEIPIPGIVRVPTYGTDYLPVRRERNTYIRPKGAAPLAAATATAADRRLHRCPQPPACLSPVALTCCSSFTSAPHHLPAPTCTGGVGYEDPILVEYDLDSEDERWLKQYNGNEVRQPGCLWRGATPAWGLSPAPLAVAAVPALPRVVPTLGNTLKAAPALLAGSAWDVEVILKTCSPLSAVDQCPPDGNPSATPTCSP
jgi:hypothetical protein